MNRRSFTSSVVFCKEQFCFYTTSDADPRVVAQATRGRYTTGGRKPLDGASPRPPSLLTGERRRRPAAAPNKAAVRNPLLPPLPPPFFLPSLLSPWWSAAGVTVLGQIRALHGRIRVLPTWIRAQGADAVVDGVTSVGLSRAGLPRQQLGSRLCGCSTRRAVACWRRERRTGVALRGGGGGGAMPITPHRQLGAASSPHLHPVFPPLTAAGEDRRVARAAL